MPHTVIIGAVILVILIVLIAFVESKRPRRNLIVNSGEWVRVVVYPARGRFNAISRGPDYRHPVTYVEGTIGMVDEEKGIFYLETVEDGVLEFSLSNPFLAVVSGDFMQKSKRKQKPRA